MWGVHNLSPKKNRSLLEIKKT
ncbi:hypothetical protein VCHENC02_1359A, partial [Vibrio harveyi]